MSALVAASPGPDSSSFDLCLGVLTIVAVEPSPEVVAELPDIGLKSGSITELQPEPALAHFTFLFRSFFSASLSISHLRIFSARSAFFARSYAPRLSCTDCASDANCELGVEPLDGVSTSISPVEGLIPWTPR